MSTKHAREGAKRIVYGDRPIRHPGPPDSPIYLVPSEHDPVLEYTVNFERKTCECPWWKKNRTTCKHLEAVNMFRVATLQTIPAQFPRGDEYDNPSYYEAVKAIEGDAVVELLRCLGNDIKLQKRKGRPQKDVVSKFVAFGRAAYHDSSSRTMSEGLAGLVKLGTIKEVVPQSSYRRYMHARDCTQHLKKTFETVALLVKRMETMVTIDSTFLKTPNNQTKVEMDKGEITLVERKKTGKVHLAHGIVTKMILGLMFRKEHDSDRKAIKPLIKLLTPYSFDIWIADEQYNSAQNYKLIKAAGATAFIDFKRTAKKNGDPHYDRQLELCLSGDPAWFDVYNMRALSESGNHTVKTGRKRRLRGRSMRGMCNEMLMTAIVINLCRLLMLRRQFWPDFTIPFADERAMEVIRKSDPENDKKPANGKAKLTVIQGGLA